jgi:Putative transmembrane protein (PGPGW)
MIVSPLLTPLALSASRRLGALPAWLPQSWTHLLEHLSAEWWLLLSLFSAVLFVSTVLGASWALRRLPADYLLTDGSELPARRLGRVGWVLRNGLGLILLVLGVAMLVLPGQGLLTILAAFSIMDFRGKRRLEHRLMLLPRVFDAINRLRRRAGQPPLQQPKRGAGSHDSP